MKRKRSHFTYDTAPMLKYSRSMFDLSHKHLTSMNVGELTPFMCEEVYPGDTFKITAHSVIRASSPLLRPTMDNAFIEEYFFYVPSRLCYDKLPNVFGENTESPWANTKEYTIPMIPVSATTGNTVVSKTVADHLGLPIGKLGRPVSILPFRAFAKIWEDWFRDENNVSPMHIQKGDFVTSENLNTLAWSPSNYTGYLPKVAKFHDMFTSCLPAPQKGDSVKLPLSGDAPVLARGDGTNVTSGLGVIWGFNGSLSQQYGSPILESNGSYGTMYASPGVPANTTKIGAMYPKNLIADLSDVTAATVNDLRLAFQLQKMLERDARGGTRYVEYLLSHWGVSSPDARLQRSEFLGGKSTPLQITQVTQTNGSSETAENNSLGELGANSLTVARARATKGFVEHGYVIGVACIRQFHSYQQGIRKFWTRSQRTDFYDPVFANIGEQPIYKSELYGLDGVANDSVFGYQEAWIQLRKSPNEITGQMRTGVDGSLDLYHLGDYYQNAPTLNEQFINETSTYFDRVLTVKSTVQDQFIVDFYIQNIAYRRLPTYSVPSLIDHN